MARDIRWQDICDNKVTNKRRSKKLVRETVLIFYASFESNIDVGCNILVRHIGRFKGAESGVKREAKIKHLNRKKNRFDMKWLKAKQRLWAKNKFDNDWIDDDDGN